MTKQLSMFDYQTAKKQVPNLSKRRRFVINNELIKFLEYTALKSSTDYEYSCELEMAHSRNKILAENLLKNYTSYTIGIGIIYFLSQLEDNKKIYNRRVKEMRTYTMNHFFELERGSPYEFLYDLMRKVSKKADFSEYSNVISSLLLKNIGEKEGKEEKFFLGILEMIGTKKDVATLNSYMQKVFKGNFGHPAYTAIGNNMVRVQGAVKDNLRNKLILRIKSIIAKILKR